MGLSLGFHTDPTTPRSAVLLKQATMKKKEGDIDSAISCLREAYVDIAQTGRKESPQVFLRLPMYLQQAGKREEAWSEFNAMLAGKYPIAVDDPAFASLWQSQIYDKMTLFLQREKKYLEAAQYYILYYLSYCKWLSYQVAHPDKAAGRGLNASQRAELQEHTSIRSITDCLGGYLKRAKKEKLTKDVARVVKKHVDQKACLSLTAAMNDVRAVLAAEV